MKFKELSYEKLIKEFKKILNKFTDEDLFKSLTPYIDNKEDSNDDKSNKT